MANTVNLPLLGPTSKPVVFASVGAGILVSGYMILRQEKKNKQAAAAAAANASKSSGYGYGYGYGSQVPYGGQSGYGYGAYGEFSPYPQEEVYGYGAYGYGLYNPYTGQYYGAGTTSTGTATEGTTPATNAQWEQDAIAILSGQGYTATAIENALGIYLNDGPYTSWNAQDQTILNAAIGAAGEPPDPPASEPPGVGTSTGSSGGGGGTGTTGGNVKVPNVEGQRVDQATSAITSAGLRYRLSGTRKPNVAYYVNSQTPGAGKSVASGSYVDLGISTNK
jgi:hypothetical protein